MSRKWMFVVLSGLVGAFLLLGPRIGDALHRELMRLHGHQPHAAAAEDATASDQGSQEAQKDAKQGAAKGDEKGTDEVAEEGTEKGAEEADDGWPQTPAGRMARAWVDAYAAGRESMEGFLRHHLSDESLARRTMEDRLEKTDALYQRLGRLVLAAVEDSQDYRLVAALLAEDGDRHRFVFELEEEPPHALVSISMLHASGPGGHGGHGQSQ